MSLAAQNPARTPVSLSDYLPRRADPSRLTSRNTKLLSFGEAEEIPEEEIIVKKKGIVRRDCESEPARS